MEYKVVFEIQVGADSPLEAAKNVQEMMRDPDCDWQFYVQNAETSEIVSVDLEEDDENAVCKVDNYIPLIN